MSLETLIASLTTALEANTAALLGAKTAATVAASKPATTTTTAADKAAPTPAEIRKAAAAEKKAAAAEKGDGPTEDDLRAALTKLQNHYSSTAKNAKEKDSAKDKCRVVMKEFGGAGQISKIDVDKYPAVIGEVNRIVDGTGEAEDAEDDSFE